jgi:tRNA A22 N-methylase
VRLSDFWERLEQVFGPEYAASLARDQVLAGLGGRTITEALAAGQNAKDVWRAVVAAFPDRVPARLR